MSILVLTQTGGILKPFAIILGFIMNYIYRFLQIFGINNVALTIILFTLVINVLMIPLTVKQQKFSKMSSLMNPELQKVQKKYQNRKDEKSMRMMQAETQAIYDKYGASPTGGCLPMLIQLPILFALYRVIYNVPAYVEPVREIYEHIAQPIMSASGAGDIMTTLIKEMSLRVSNFDISNINKIIDAPYVEPVREIYEHIAQPIMSASGAGDIMTTLIKEMSLRVSNFDISNINKIIDALYVVKSTGWSAVSDAFSGSADVVSAISQYSTEIIHINSIPGGLNIADAPVALGHGISGIFPGIIIPALAGLSQWANLKVSQRNQPKPDLDSTMGSTMNTMNLMMPFMSVFFCITLPSGMGIYWIASAVFRTIIYLFIDKFFNNKSVDDIIEANKEKAAKKAEKRGEQNAKLEEYAAMKTKNMIVVLFLRLLMQAKAMEMQRQRRRVNLPMPEERAARRLIRTMQRRIRSPYPDMRIC